ncbi:MAG: hypothetical protein AB7N80_04960 [Bdellovibrionales bacterium]
MALHHLKVALFCLQLLLCGTARAAGPICNGELKPGESRDYCGHKASTTGVWPCYRLTRNAQNPKQYTALLTLRFNYLESHCRGNQECEYGDANHLMQKMTDPKKIVQMDRDYRAFVQGCYDDANPFLNGPNYENLKLTLGAPMAAHAGAPPVREVNVYDYAVDRESDDTWSPLGEMSCATVMHETMHILGLVDEYEEAEGHYLNKKGQRTHRETDTWRSIYSCRSLGPESSIMSNPFAGDDIEEDPSGTTAIFAAQFREIVYHDCPELNRVYRSCARNAYRGAGHCLKVDPICKAPDFKWLE